MFSFCVSAIVGEIVQRLWFLTSIAVVADEVLLLMHGRIVIASKYLFG